MVAEAAQEHNPVAREVQTAVRHSAMYGLGNIIAKAMGFLMVPFYTHYLNPVDYGILELLDLSMSLFGMLLNMGITAALLRSYSDAKTAEEKRVAVSTAFLFVTVTGVLTFVLAVGLVPRISSMLFGPSIPSRYLLLSFSSFILGYIANLPRTYLRALEASGRFVLVDTLSLVLMLVLNVVFIAVLQIGLMGILLSSLISAVLQVVVLCGWIVRRTGFGFSGRILRTMVSFGLPLIFSNLALFSLNFADRFFLKHFQSLEVVGLYAVGYKFGFMLNYLLVQPFYVMWQARMYAIREQQNHPEVFNQIFVLYSFLLTYAGLGFAMFSTEVVHVMAGQKFAGSAEVIPIVTLAYVFCGIGYFTQSGMFLTNRTNVLGAVSAAAAVLNLVLNYWLILHYGMSGAAWATVLSFAAIAVASYWFSQKVFHLPLAAGRVGTAIALAIGFYLLGRYASPESFAGTVLMKAGLLAAFPLVLWKGRLISQLEIGTLSSARHSAEAALSRRFGYPLRKAAGA